MLNESDLAKRVGKLTASRIACLMRADTAAIHRLYLELIGDLDPETLDHVWPVRRGQATEDINLEWFERKNGGPLERRTVHNPEWSGFRQHPVFDWAAATIDAWYPSLRCPIEAKDVGGREPVEVVIERYQPQCQWQMECTGSTQCGLSIIIGGAEPIVEFLDRDGEYAAEMIDRGGYFMRCVRERRAPVIIDPAPPPIVADRTVDMTGNNQWAHAAALWLETRELAIVNRDNEKTLKNIVPDEARKAFGHGVRITRDRADRLSLRQDKEEK